MEKQETRPIIAWVEDDPDFQIIVREWLKPRYELITYRDGEAFLSDMGEIEPDVIMLDVRLPGPDGFKLCRKVRADRRLSKTPIIFLTSCQEDEAYIEHLDVGGTAFLSKPVGKKALISLLGELIDGERKFHPAFKERKT